MSKIDNEEKNLINKYFELFSESVTKILSQNLDKDICKKIQFPISSITSIDDPETLKGNNIIYKIGFATGSYQGEIISLIPEELAFSIADIIMGGSGEEKYKGALTELETNSISALLEKIFKDVEESFKILYNQDLAFSSKPQLILKEMDDYQIKSDDNLLDLLAINTLTLNESKEYEISSLLNQSTIVNMMSDLGLAKVSAPAKKIDLSSLDVSRLADVKINITAELGRTRVPMKYALELIRGSLVELDTLNGEDIKVFANDVEFARAQVVAVEENFGLKITKIISPEERLESL